MQKSATAAATSDWLRSAATTRPLRPWNGGSAKGKPSAAARAAAALAAAAAAAALAARLAPPNPEPEPEPEPEPPKSAEPPGCGGGERGRTIRSAARRAAARAVLPAAKSGRIRCRAYKGDGVIA